MNDSDQDVFRHSKTLFDRKSVNLSGNKSGNRWQGIQRQVLQNQIDSSMDESGSLFEDVGLALMKSQNEEGDNERQGTDDS